MPAMEPRTPPAHPRSEPTGAPGVDLVAATMRRVHAQLRGGAAPSYEALLALGEPGRG
jgi:hypothetical protein